MSFDNQGLITSMHAVLININTLNIFGQDMRTNLIVDAQCNTMQAHWEKLSEENIWVPWMEITFRKIED